MKYLGKMIPFIALLLLSATCWATLESQTVAAQEIHPARSPRQVAREVMASLLGTPAPAPPTSPKPGAFPTVEYLVLQATCAGSASLPQSRPHRRHLAVLSPELCCLDQPFNYDICLCQPPGDKISP